MRYTYRDLNRRVHQLANVLAEAGVKPGDTVAVMDWDSHRQLVLHTYGLMSGMCIYRSQLTLDSGDVYMPITPMFHVHAWGVPYLCTMIGTKQVYPGRYEPEMLLKATCRSPTG